MSAVNAGFVLLNDPPIGDSDNQAICVLGMPRGGTTMVLKLLQALGVFAGDKLPPSAEDPEFAELLKQPAFSKADYQALAARRFKDHNRWVFKAPPHKDLEFLKSLPNCRFVVVLRNPLAAANLSKTPADAAMLKSIMAETARQGQLIKSAAASGAPVFLLSFEAALHEPDPIVEGLVKFCGLKADGPRVPVPKTIAETGGLREAAANLRTAAPKPRRQAAEAHKGGGAASAERDRPMSVIGKPWKPPLTDTPRPMVNSRKQLMVLWSPKSACTTTYVWFSHVSGFLSQVRKYANWPHKHRIDIYEKSKLYNESVEADLSGLRSVRIIRDPYSRAVSIYRHALQTNFANRSLAEYQSGKWSLDEGMSFQQFLDFVATLDMVNVDIHFRPQFHSFEAEHTPTRVINISKQDLFAGLNAFERDAGLPETDFKSFDWLHDLEGKRKALHVPLEGDHLDRIQFNRKIVSEGQFPSYSQLLTPEAKQKIEAIYSKDFTAYRDYL